MDILEISFVKMSISIIPNAASSETIMMTEQPLELSFGNRMIFEVHFPKLQLHRIRSLLTTLAIAYKYEPTFHVRNGWIVYYTGLFNLSFPSIMTLKYLVASLK